MSFPYKKVLVIGATSGIGEALAARLIEDGRKVVVSGRRQENLDRFVEQRGAEHASAFKVDISDLTSLPSFAAKVTSAHPDLDCIILNSGMQRPFNFALPQTVDLALLSTELTTNYLAHIHLTMAFLPHLQRLSKTQPTALVYTNSGLGLIPLIRCANYCATKAALHHWTLCLREQLNDDPESDVKIIELLPPAVQTELHDQKHQPDIENGAQIGMPLKEYIDATWKGLCAGKLFVPVGMAEKAFESDGFETKRQEAFLGMKKARGEKK